MTPRSILGRILAAVALLAVLGVADRLTELAASGTPCPEPLGPNATTHGDYVDFIRFEDRDYYQARHLPAGTRAGVLGRKLGTVQCELTGKDTEGYDIRSGDAAHLSPGTPFFAHEEKRTEKWIVVRHADGSLDIYSTRVRGHL